MKYFSRTIFIACSVIFFAIASFGVQMGIGEINAGSASACPFTQEAMSLCPMNIVDHITAWEQMFVALPGTELTIASVLLFAGAFIFLQFRRFGDFWELTTICCCNAWRQTAAKLYNYFNALFSRGVLHPKIYA